MKKIPAPGAVWITLLAGALYGLQETLQVEYAGAEWLPIALAFLGYAWKFIDVYLPKPQVLPEQDETLIAPAATPQASKPERAKVIRFIVG